MKYSRAAGFTLIELMVTIAIVAILGLVAAPSFVAFQRNSELTGTANSLLSALNAARGEGMKRNMPSAVQAIGGSWENGWRVFVDVKHDGASEGAYDDGTDILISTFQPLNSYFSVGANGSATPGGNPVFMGFNGSGFAIKTGLGSSTNLTLSLFRNDLSGPDLLMQTRRVVISNTGRARVCKPTSATDANCSAP